MKKHINKRHYRPRYTQRVFFYDSVFGKKFKELLNDEYVCELEQLSLKHKKILSNGEK